MSWRKLINVNNEIGSARDYKRDFRETCQISQKIYLQGDEAFYVIFKKIFTTTVFNHVCF